MNDMERTKCIVCKTPTPFDKNTHVELRSNYIEGVGQLCKNCWDRLYENVDLKNGK